MSTGGDVAPSRRRRGVVITASVVIGSLVLAGGLGWYGATHTAYGLEMNGAGVGGQSVDAAVASVAHAFPQTRITIVDGDRKLTATAAELGLSLKSTAALRKQLEGHSMLKVGSWNTAVGLDGDVSVDQTELEAHLAQAWPDRVAPAKDPQISFDAATQTWTVTPGQSAKSLDVAAAAQALVRQVRTAGTDRVQVRSTTVAPAVSDQSAQSTADALNRFVRGAVFTSGGVTVAQVPVATAASWVTVAVRDGRLVPDFDQSRIADYAKTTLPAQVNTAGVPAQNITNSSGKVLSVQRAGVPQRQLTSTDFAADVVKAYNAGTYSYALPVEEKALPAQNVVHRIEVDLGARTATLYENDAVVKTMPISSGKPGFATEKGHFTVYLKYATQTMKGAGYGPGYDYVTPNVPWVSYFNGGEAFHGAPWNSQIGVADLSHGCVNLGVGDAQFVYNWAPTGTEVWVH